MTRNFLRFALALVVASTTATSAHAETGPSLHIESRVARFQQFYRAARPMKDANVRFRIWQRLDGLAAVPPGKTGDRMARQLLDAAWPRYPSIVSTLPRLTSDAEAAARRLFSRDVRILDAQQLPLVTRLILYVGQFDNNALTVPPMHGQPATVLMPIENNNLSIALAHELAHSIHMQLAHVRNSFGAPVGELIFLEGLAMRVSQRAVPGRPESSYAAMPGDSAWLVRCYRQEKDVLNRIEPDLEKSGPEIAMKYTFGHGNTGLTREAYCAAWVVVGNLISEGHTLPQLARIPEGQMISVVRKEIERQRAP